MADRIVVSTELLEEWARKLEAVQENLSNASGILTNVNTTEDSGGELSITVDSKLQNGAHISGENVVRTVRSIRNAMKETARELDYSIAGVLNTAKLFEEAENNAIQSISDPTISNGSETDAITTEKTSQSEYSQSPGQLDKAEMDNIANMIAVFLEDSNTMVLDNFNQFELVAKTIAAGFYSLGNENYDKLFNNYYITHQKLLDSILDKYSSGSGILDFFTDNGGQIKKSAGTISDLMDADNLTYVADNPIQYAVYQLAKKNPELSADPDSIELLNGLSKVGKAAGDVKWATEVFNRYIKMMNMDPATAKVIADGLLANGDAASFNTAAALYCVGDPVACLKYSISTAGWDFIADTANDGIKALVKDAAEANPTTMAAYASAKIATAGTDAVANTQKTSDAIIYAQGMNNIQKQSYANAQKALNDYRTNPCSATYEKMKQAFNGYSITSAETLNAYSSAVDTRDSSVAGKVKEMIFGDKTSSWKSEMNKNADNIREHIETINKVESAFWQT